MAVCSFLGHTQIYDAEIDSMLQNSIERIVAENKKTDFLFYHCDGFYSRCFLTVLKAKVRRPENITITLVLSEEDYRRQETGSIPVCLIDRVIFPNPKECKSKDPKKVMQWIIQQSTHLISYLYKKFYEQENRILEYAQNKPDLRIIDITDVDTEQEILNQTGHMKERELYIFERLNDGSTPKEVAETLQIGTNRLQQVLNHGCRTLREQMSVRYHHLSAQKSKVKKSVCSIFSPGEATYESLKAFECIVSFLLSKCDVTHFEISTETRCSGFMYVLEKYMKSGWFSQRNLEIIQGSVDADMIGRSDYCVCNLSDVPAADEVREYISQTKDIILVNMGQTCSQIYRHLACTVFERVNIL